MASDQDFQDVKDALTATLKFLVCEQHWEGFRKEMLYGDNREKQTVSAQNAEKLRRWIRELAKRSKVVAQCIKDAGA